MKKAPVDVCEQQWPCWSILYSFLTVNSSIDVDASSTKGTSLFLLFCCGNPTTHLLHRIPSFLLPFSFSLQSDRPNSHLITHCFSHSPLKNCMKDRLSPHGRSLCVFRISIHNDMADTMVAMVATMKAQFTNTELIGRGFLDDE